MQDSRRENEVFAEESAFSLRNRGLGWIHGGEMKFLIR